jgi:hypothetical protein
MDLINAYFYAKDIISKPSLTLLNNNPKERAIKAMNNLLSEGNRIDIEKTRINKLIMPIFDDLDLFSLHITKLFLKIKEQQKEINNSPLIDEISDNHIENKLKDNYKEITTYGFQFENEFNDFKEELSKLFEKKKKRIKKITRLEQTIKKTKEKCDKKLTKLDNLFNFWNDRIKIMSDFVNPIEYKIQDEDEIREKIKLRLKQRRIENLKMKYDDIEIFSEVNRKVPIRIISKIGHYKKNDLNPRFMFPPKLETYIGPSNDLNINDNFNDDDESDFKEYENENDNNKKKKSRNSIKNKESKSLINEKKNFLENIKEKTIISTTHVKEENNESDEDENIYMQKKKKNQKKKKEKKE